MGRRPSPTATITPTAAVASGSAVPPRGRRLAGSGSVYPETDARGRRRWVAAVRLPNGKRKKRIAATKAEALAKLADLHRLAGAGALAPPTRLRVQEWLARWLAQKSVRPKTLSVYTRALRYLAEDEVLGPTRLDKVTPLLLADVFARLARAGVGGRMREHVFTYGKAAFADAVRAGLVPSNPFDRVERAAKPRHTPRERPTWSPAEVARFVAVGERSRLRYAPLCVVAVLTGLRRGELCGLLWRDVDFGQGVLSVRRQRAVVAGRPETGSLKTRAAHRTVPLGERALAVLRQQWERTPPEGREPDRPVFATTTGTPPHPDNLKRTLHRLCQAADVPVVTLHQLRHVYASLAAAGGLDPVALARVMGHSRPSVSLDIYTYALNTERAAGAVERGLGIPDSTQP